MRAIFIIFLLMFSGLAQSVAQCVNQGQVCMDASPSKIISGTVVTLASIGETCWDYKTTYSCDLLNIDTCAPLIAKGCSQTGSTCAQTDPVTGSCLLYDQTYSCNQTTCDKSTGTNQICHQSLTFTVVQPASVAATPVYKCPIGSVLIGTTCQAASFAASVNYSCTAGSVLNGTTCQPAPTTATLSYSCVSGTLSGSQCVQPAISATTTYSCPVGSTLSGTSCVPATINATVTYSCATGTLSGTQCTYAAYQPAGVGATSNAPGTCGNGLDLLNGYCYLCVQCSACPGLYGSCGFSAGIIPKGPPTITYSCPAGYTLSGSTCYPPLFTPSPSPATATISCPAGYTLSGTTCIAPNTTATATRSCPLNYSLSGSSCVTPSTAATASYSCPVTNTLVATNCYPPPVGATVSYTCPAPAVLKTSTCTPPATTAPVTYSCGPGMAVVGSSCVPAAIVTENYIDSCANLQAKTL